MSVAYGKGAKGRATRLHSLIVRSRGVCECCGEREYARLQCAHIVPRGFAWTRTDENNGLCLCASCHAKFTGDPFEWVVFVTATIGAEAYELLRLKAREGVARKFPWEAEVIRLRALAADLGVAA